MDAHAVSLLAVFEKKARLEVPLFQRQYVWGLEIQWAPLWEDLSRKFQERLDAVAESAPHFLGAIVLDQRQTPITEVEKRLIIDGQQRLTTIQIFLAALRDFSAREGFADIADECTGFILNKGMMTSEIEQFKVWPTQVDRTQFSDVVLAGSRTEVERRHPLTRKRYARQPDPRPRMVEAYLFFYDCLDEFFHGSNGEPPVKDAVPLHDRLRDCLLALKSSLKIVAIDLDRDDDAQVIFETLNVRGAPLLPADLLRNYVFLRAARRQEDQEKLYGEYWKDFDDDFWRTEIQQGRLLRPRSDLFMQHFLSSRRCIDVPSKHLFVEYKFWIEHDHPFATVREELESLARQRQDFRRLISPAVDDPLRPLSYFLAEFDVGTAHPFLLAVLNARPTDTDLLKISGLLQSYIVRRSVCNLTTKNYNRVFLQLTRGLQGASVTPQAVLEQLAGLVGPSAEWPTDDRFRDSWINGQAYTYLSNQKLVHILRRLSDTYLGPKTEELVIGTPLTIEHVLPQFWLEEWPLRDGTAGMSFDELLSAPEGDARAASTRRRNELLQTIGNLTLLTQPLNSAVSNSAWDLKKPEILKASLLPINQQFYSVDVWNEDAILSRGRELLERALRLWPRAVSP